MSSLRLGEPESLARLPRPATANAQTRLSVVHGITDGVVRKRQEICAAIDGDSLSIYEVRRGKNVSSVSVPPDSVFECTPASFRIKTENGSALRRTYCVIRRRNITTLQLFQEEYGQEKIHQPTQSLPLGQFGAPILEIVPLQALEAVAVVYQNGRYEIIVADLSSTLFSGRLDCGLNNVHFALVSFMPVADASTSILNGRPDIIAAVAENSVFACGVTTTRNDATDSHHATHYHVWQLSFATTTAVKTMPIFSFPLPGAAHLPLHNRGSATFVSKNTKLVLRSPSRVIKYDLASVVPRHILDFTTPSSDQISNVEISDNLLLFSNSGTLQLYNSSFRSLQASFQTGNAGSKRKRGNTLSGPVSLLAYFPSLHRAIGIRRNYLMAVDLLGSSSGADLQQSSLLLQNIGKGNAIHPRPRSNAQSRHTTLGTIKAYPEISEDWMQIAKSLDMLAAEGKEIAFESEFLRHVQDIDNVTTTLQPLASEHKALYALCKIFKAKPTNGELSTDHDLLLTLQLRCFNLLTWLIERGYLTPTRLTEAMSQSASGNVNVSISSISVIKCLVEVDSDLLLLQQYILRTPRFRVEELCQIARFVISMAVARFSQTANENSADLPRGYQQNALSRTSDHSSNFHASQIDALLSSILVRIARLHRGKLSQELRSTFERQDLLALVQFLRQKLFHSGYTRSLPNVPYSDPPDLDIEPMANQKPSIERHPELPLDAIVIVLSSCVDAIGTLGLLNTHGDDEFADKLVSELSSEISRAAEAIDDAVFLQGVVRETLRYSESVAGSKKDWNNTQDTDTQKQKSGTIRTLYSVASSDRLASTLSALPISLQAEGRIAHYKTSRGSGKSTERSKREMGMLQDRLRGPYAFERLAL